MDFVNQYLAAKEEHERALRQVKVAQEALARAREEFAQAQSLQQDSERQVDDATAQLTARLQSAQVSAATNQQQEQEEEEDTEKFRESCGIDRFLVEFHGNIGCYNAYLMLKCPSKSLTADQFEVRVEFPQVFLNYSSLNAKAEKQEEAEEEEEEVQQQQQQEAAVVWQTHVEHLVDQANVSLTLKEDHLHVRLPLEEHAKQAIIASSLGSASTSSSLSRFSREELDCHHFEWIKCRSCDHFLRRQQQQPETDAKCPRITQVLPLPSSNWMEMFDFWGAGAGGFEHLPREDIFAKQGRILIGENHFLVHANDLMATRLGVVGNDPVSSKFHTNHDDDWHSIWCRNCGEMLGGRHSEQPDTLRFWKHTVACGTLTQDATNLFARYSVDSMVSAPMLEQVESDGVFCFEVGGYQPCGGRGQHHPPPPPPPPHHHHHHHQHDHQHQARGADLVNNNNNKQQDIPASSSLFVQLLNWETMLHTWNSPGCDHDKSKDLNLNSDSFVRVLKVLYTTTKRPNGKQFHPLACPNETIRNQILQRLEQSNELLPPSMRCFGSMSVGYLFA